MQLQLFALAYNLGNSLRRLALPRSLQHWSLNTLREKLERIQWFALPPPLPKVE